MNGEEATNSRQNIRRRLVSREIIDEQVPIYLNIREATFTSHTFLSRTASVGRRSHQSAHQIRASRISFRVRLTFLRDHLYHILLELDHRLPMTAIFLGNSHAGTFAELTMIVANK